MTGKLKSHAIAVAKFTSAIVAGAAFVVGFGFTVAALSSVNAWPQEAPEGGIVQTPIYCSTFKGINKSLTERGLHDAGGGFVSDQIIVAIYTTADSSLWALVSIGSDGSACLISSGSDWFAAPTQKGAPA